MKIKNYNTYQKCSKCPNVFWRTNKTGNICHYCRKANQKIRNKRNIKFNTDIKGKEVIDFINKVERRGGWIYSFSEMNELLDCWTIVTEANRQIYDPHPPGHQLHFMWLDLLNWYDCIKNPPMQKMSF